MAIVAKGGWRGQLLAANEVLLVAAINDGFIDGSSIDGMLHSVMRAVGKVEGE